MPGPVTRDDFDAHWLEKNNLPTSYKRFIHTPLKERPGARDLIKAALKKAVVDHHKQLKSVAKLIVKHGFPRTAQLLVQQLPRDTRTRMGNFGEVVSSEHLRQRHGYKMPVFKLRFADSPLLPMRGEDIICFEIDETSRITRLCIGEAKALSSFRSNTVLKAHERLRESYHPLPISLSMIVNILYERNDDDLAEQIETIIEALPSRPFPRQNWIFVLLGEEHADTFGVIENDASVLQDLFCVDIYLPNLQSLVNEIFDHPLSW